MPTHLNPLHRMYSPHAALLTALAAGLLTLSCAAQAGRVDFSDEGDFSEEAIMSGVRATRADCVEADGEGADTEWVNTPQAGAECIKFWKAGFDTLPVQRAVVFFHGDIFVGRGKTSPSYLDLSNAQLQKNANAWAKRLGVPYIFVGRPGTHGSSGDHMQRRRLPESLLMSALLDALKVRYGVAQWVVAGQSGGGHITSALLTQRADVVCAVPTSAVSSPRMRWETMGRTRDTTHYADSYEPTQHLGKVQAHPQLRVFVLGDPGDRNVFWPTQTVMADALRQARIPVEVLEGEGTGPERHGLSNSGRTVAGWCAQDMPTDDIVKRAAKGLKG